jgi:hypothetical protein
MQLRRVVSLEGDTLVVFYYLNATKRGGLSWRGHISSILLSQYIWDLAL